MSPPPALHRTPHVPGAPRWLLSGTSRPSFRPLLTSLPGVVLRATGSGRRGRLLPLTAVPLSPVFLTERLKSRGSRSEVPGGSRSKGALTRIYRFIIWAGASLIARTVKSLPAVQEMWVRSLGWEDPLEKETATHFSILAWRTPWTEEPGRVQSMGSQRDGHD